MTPGKIFYSVYSETELDVGAASVTPRSGLARQRLKSAALARDLLSRMLADIWGIAPENVKIRSERSGRPYVEPVLPQPSPFISISHSRGWIACAATEIGPLGIDIERQRPGRDHAGIAAMAFGPREVARTCNSGIGAFYRIWTLREAIAKARGQGLALAADGLDRVHEGPEVGQWFATLDQAVWSLSHNLIDEDTSFATAVVLPEPCQTVRLERWGAEWP